MIPLRTPGQLRALQAPAGRNYHNCSGYGQGNDSLGRRGRSGNRLTPAADTVGIRRPDVYCAPSPRQIRQPSRDLYTGPYTPTPTRYRYALSVPTSYNRFEPHCYGIHESPTPAIPRHVHSPDAFEVNEGYTVQWSQATTGFQDADVIKPSSDGTAVGERRALPEFSITSSGNQEVVFWAQ